MKKLLLLLPIFATVSLRAADPNPQDPNNNASAIDVEAMRFRAEAERLNAMIQRLTATLQLARANASTAATHQSDSGS